MITKLQDYKDYKDYKTMTVILAIKADTGIVESPESVQTMNGIQSGGMLGIMGV